MLAVERMLPQFCVVLMKESHPVLSFLALFLIKTIACSKTHDIRIISTFLICASLTHLILRHIIRVLNLHNMEGI